MNFSQGRGDIPACHPEQREGSPVWARALAGQRKSFALLRMTRGIFPVLTSKVVNDRSKRASAPTIRLKGIKLLAERVSRARATYRCPGHAARRGRNQVINLCMQLHFALGREGHQFDQVVVVTDQVADEVDLVRDDVDGGHVEVAAVADDIVRTGLPQHCYRFLLRASLTNKVDHRFGPSPIGKVTHLFHVAAIGHNRVVCAPFFCQFESGGRAVDHDNLGWRQGFEALHANMAETASPDHYDFCARIKLSRCLFNCMVRGQTGISERGNVFRMKGWIEFDNRAGAGLEEFCHAAINGNTGEGRVGAVHVITSAAGATEATGNERVNDHGIANSHIADSRTHFLHPASIFMPNGIRQLHARFLRPLPLNNVQVGTTDARATDTHNDIPGAGDLWIVNLFYSGKLMVLVNPDSFHTTSPSRYASSTPALA